jgi:hypothetical protein
MEMDAIINDWKQNAERHDSRNVRFLRSLKMKNERVVDRVARMLHEGKRAPEPFLTGMVG